MEGRPAEEPVWQKEEKEKEAGFASSLCSGWLISPCLSFQVCKMAILLVLSS